MSEKSSTFAAQLEGKLSEWSKEPHSKCGVHIALYRGFESLTFRTKNEKSVCPSLLEQADFSLFLMPYRILIMTYRSRSAMSVQKIAVQRL